MRAHIRFILVVLLHLFLILTAGTVSAAGSLSGTVTEYGTDVPRQGIEINLFRSEDPNSAGDDAWIPVHSVLTDINGNYIFTNLEPRQYRVHIGATTDSSGRHFVQTDLYNVQVFDNTETTDMDLRLHEAGFIWGYVRTASGTPIPGAEVRAHAEWVKEGKGWHHATTDDTGLYRIWVLPSPGEFYVVISHGAVLNIDTPDPTAYEPAVAPGLYQATLEGSHWTLRDIRYLRPLLAITHPLHTNRHLSITAIAGACPKNTTELDYRVKMGAHCQALAEIAENQSIAARSALAEKS